MRLWEKKDTGIESREIAWILTTTDGGFGREAKRSIRGEEVACVDF